MKRHYNQEAALKTKAEYLDNFKAVKGEPAALFIEQTAFVIAAGQAIHAGLQRQMSIKAAQDMLANLLDANISLLAEKYGVGLQGNELLTDTQTMMKAIEEAAQSSIITL